MKKLLIILTCMLTTILASAQIDTNNLKTETFIDSRDGKIYKTVRIGSQIWMAENLAYLSSVSPSAEGSDTEPYCYVYG